MVLQEKRPTLSSGISQKQPKAMLVVKRREIFHRIRIHARIEYFESHNRQRFAQILHFRSQVLLNNINQIQAMKMQSPR